MRSSCRSKCEGRTLQDLHPSDHKCNQLNPKERQLGQNKSPSMPAIYVISLLILSTLAAIAGLLFDPASFWVNILSTLALLGPTALASIFIVGGYFKMKRNQVDSHAVATVLMEILRTISLTEEVISRLYGPGYKCPSTDLQTLRVSRREHPFDGILRYLRELNTRFSFAEQHPNINKHDILPWRFTPELLALPDYRLIRSSVESISSDHAFSFLKYFASMASGWYESAPVQITNQYATQSCTQVATGFPQAMNMANLEAATGNKTVILQPPNYLPIVYLNLSLSIRIIELMKVQLNIPQKLLHQIMLATTCLLEEDIIRSMSRV